MNKSNKKGLSKIELSILVALLWLCCTASVIAGGLDWGGGFGGGDTTSCVPDSNLVIKPGPIGSPIRISVLDEQTFLIADYTRGWIYKADLNGLPVKFFEVEGKPLSIASRPSHDLRPERLLRRERPSRKERTTKMVRIPKADKEASHYYYVGNDKDKTIDLYEFRKDQVVLKKKWLRHSEGVQALDMVYDTTLRQLFVVDGLAREIKVFNRKGHQIRRFGGDQVLSDPKGLAVDSATGEVFVSDYGDPVVGIPASIKVFDLSGSLERTISGNFSRPQGLSLSGNKLFLADNMLAQILEFDRTTNVKTTSYGCQGSSEGRLLLPMDVASDEAGLNLYVADNRNMRVTVLPLSGSQ